MISERRQFIKKAGLMGGGLMALQMTGNSNFPGNGPEIACQYYTWFSFLRRENLPWEKDPAGSYKTLSASGVNSYEPSFQGDNHARGLLEELKKNKISAKSFYVNSTLHKAEEGEQSLENVMAISDVAIKYGAGIVVTNPSPIRWGDPVDKNDEELDRQAKLLDRLGSMLRKKGLKLAYHNHDMEMRQSAREFHHMMLNTSPENVHLCLDAHWIYRGAGNSQLALFDIVKLYGERIVEVHLRQSTKGVWSEVFGPGDIDYERLADTLMKTGLKPHLVIEQAAEEGTPKTMEAAAAIQKSIEYARDVFKDF